MLTCLIRGDSIAADTATALRFAQGDRCAIVARKGAGTPAIMEMAPSAAFDTAVLSARSNDAGNITFVLALARLRMSVTARFVVWILPYDRRAATAVRSTAVRFGDNVVDLAGLTTRDGVHPSTYRGLAVVLRKGGYVGL